MDDEFDHRRKRYIITMTIRALCVVGAASTVNLSGWLAAAFVAGAMVLPWCAVLIANDRPPKQQVRFRRFLPGQPDGPRELTSAPAQAGHDTYDGHDRRDGRDGRDEQDPRPPRVIDL